MNFEVKMARGRRWSWVALGCMGLLLGSCITYGAFRIPLEGDTPAGQIWVGGHLEVVAIDGLDFESNLRSAWYSRLGLTYAHTEFYIAPGIHEFRVRYRRQKLRFGRLPLEITSPRQYLIRFEVKRDSITCLCAFTRDDSDPGNVDYVPDAREYNYPDDFIPEDVIYVERITKLLPPRECYERPRQGRVIARGSVATRPPEPGSSP